jgi:hypothetical protein
MRAVRVVPGMTAVLVSLVAITVAGCSPFSSSSSTAAPASQPASSAASAPSAPSTAAAAPAATPSATSSSGGVQNLIATAAVKSELLTTFAATSKIPASDVAGSVPGSVYYAYDPATQTYWAKAFFTPTSTAPVSVTVDLQEAQGGLFEKSGNGPWQLKFFVVQGQRALCEDWQFFPQAVLAAWATQATAASC